MMIQNIWENKRYYILSAILIFITLFFSIRGIGINKMIGIRPDEYGYWHTAAFLNGLEWSHGGAYYGFGYGFILSIILKLVEKTTVAYQIALILNAIMIASCIPILCVSVRLLLPKLNKYFVLLISFVSICYPANFLYAKMTMTEILILFLTCLLFLIITKYCKKPSIQYEIALIVLAGYLFMIHQRTLAIAISVVVCIIVVNIHYWRKRRLKDYLFLSFAFLSVFILQYILKDFFQNAMYADASSAAMSVNDFSGQFDKIRKIFTAEGLLQLIISFLSKVYYAASATYLFLFAGVQFCVCRIISAIKKKEIIQVLPYIYIFVQFLCAEGISSLFMQGSKNRFDTYTNGRYSDYAVVLMLMIGICYIAQSKIEGKAIIKSSIAWIILYLIIGIIVNPYLIEAEPLSITWLSCPGIADVLYKDSMDRQLGLYLFQQRAIFFFIVLLIVSKWDKSNIGMYIMLFAIAFSWIFTAHSVIHNNYYSWKIPEVETGVKTAEVIEEISETPELYSYQCETHVQTLQFLLPNYQMQLVDDIDKIENKEKVVIVTLNKKENLELLSGKWKLKYQGNRFMVFQ